MNSQSKEVIAIGSGVPTWDGQARGWRRYTKEVAWFVQGTKKHERKYLASRLIGKLTGSARLLAMSWNQSEFDRADGVLVYLRKLAKSPLVRREIPNAAAIMTQYFNFRRNSGEPISTFLVRELLGYEEFLEALMCLKEFKDGISPESKSLGLPPLEDYPDKDSDGFGWWHRQQD